MADPGRGTYRLRATIDRRERRFLLQPGVNRIGSLPTGEVVLPVPGVSRRHAEIAVEPDGATLRDLGSRNGTFLNHRRIDRTAVAPGDLVSVGGVELAVEEVGDGDGEIALRFPAPAPSGPLPAGAETSPFEREGREALALVNRLLEHTAAGTPDEISAALRLIAAACGATAALLGELDERREPVALAACGDAAAWRSAEAELRDLIRALPAAAAAPDFHVERFRHGHLTVAGLLRRERAPALYLILRGVRDERSWAAPLVEVLLRLVARATDEPAAARPAPPPLPDLVLPTGYVRGDSAAMQAIHSTLRELAASDVSVLFEGETGVGKECLVRILHDSSPRAAAPFVAINCAAIPAELLEAELFGIRKGVATGVDERKGRFQLAGAGTLLLDEIAELPAALQAKLLRVLQERSVEPVGGGAQPLAARVVAATNGRLEERVAKGLFRADLYYRIAGYVVQVPALRQRRDDIPPLVASLVRRDAAEAGKWVRGVTVKALAALAGYRWPGNVRELENEVRRLVQRCPHGEAIDSALLSPPLLDAAAGDASGGDGADPAALDLPRATADLERRLIGRALGETGGNRSQAARRLGISRNTLAEKIERLGLAPRPAADPPR